MGTPDVPSPIKDGVSPVDTKRPDLCEEWMPWKLDLPKKRPNAPPVVVRTTPGPAWDITQVLKAAALLCKPPRPIKFKDEQDMRRVYGLIYDVFRYKPILNHVIEETDFFINFPQFTCHRNLIWLFLMELARRRWMARSRKTVDAAKRALVAAGSPFQEIESTIWEQRVHFAASIARMRIMNKAFVLADLLPPHLRDDFRTTCVDKETVTGWVNTFKAKMVAELVKSLHDSGYCYSSSKQLCAGEYRFDRVCPRFITIRPLKDTSIGDIGPIKSGVIVLQEREFCEGASTLCRALRANDLQGVVAQTHASSPRSSAYLAAQLKELAGVLRAKTPPAPVTPGLGKLVVFGAGDKVQNYIGALRQLGVEASYGIQSEAPVCVLSEEVYCEKPEVISALERVVAVLAVPPNSYSSVIDPIDLVCGRGGDLSMLEILTESEPDGVGKARVQAILEEQNKTLKALLSKPQIQLVLYETHSSLDVENQLQITRAVEEANQLAKEKHLFIKKLKSHSNRVACTKSAKSTSLKSSKKSHSQSDDTSEDQFTTDGKSSPKMSEMKQREKFFLNKLENAIEQVPKPITKARPIPEVKHHISEPGDRTEDEDIAVPGCDLFEISSLPNLGNGIDMEFILDRDGIYLGLIQRKEITRLDAKFMITVAEERGLFATHNDNQTIKNKVKEPEVTHKRKKRRHAFKLERVAAPTYASISRSRRSSAPAAYQCCADPDNDSHTPKHVCQRHERRQAAAASLCHCCPTEVIKCPGPRFRSRLSSDSQKQYSIHNQQPCSQNCRKPFPLAVHDLRLDSEIYLRR